MGNALWTAGYFYRSVGAATGETIKHYIEQSQRKHWTITNPEPYTYKKKA
ncbi:MAG: transposase [Candidatus Bathycorpusculaceae bacterium]